MTLNFAFVLTQPLTVTPTPSLFIPKRRVLPYLNSSRYIQPKDDLCILHCQAAQHGTGPDADAEAVGVSIDGDDDGSGTMRFPPFLDVGEFKGCWDRSGLGFVNRIRGEFSRIVQTLLGWHKHHSRYCFASLLAASLLIRTRRSRPHSPALPESFSMIA